MVAAVFHEIARRGIQLGKGCAHKMQQHGGMAAGDPKDALDKLADKLKTPQAIVTFAITAIAFLLLNVGIEYAIRIVALNLAIVEDKESNGAIKLPVGQEYDDMAKMPLVDDFDGSEVDERAVGTPIKPVTSTLRSTFRHISSIGGFRARFRGLGFGIFHALSFGFFSLVLSVLFAWLPVMGMALARIGAAVVTCNLHATWTHATIAMPTEKPFMQRFLPRTVSRKLVLPTIRLQAGILFMQFATAVTVGFAQKTVAFHGFNWLTAQSFLLPVIAFFGISIFHVLPSHIALIRTEASLLPEDQSAIVPFDRTFGGRFNWEAMADRKTCIVRGLSVRGAYASFDKATFKTSLKIIAKLFAIMLSLTVVSSVIFAAEFYALAGNEAKVVHAHIRNQY